MNLIALALIAPFIALSAHAAPAAPCVFIAKSALRTAMTQTPSETQGLVSCYETVPDAASFVVLRIDHLNQEIFRAEVLKQANNVIPDQLDHQITGEASGANGRTLLLKSNRRGEAFLNYGFSVALADGSSLIFIHSLQERQTKRLWPKLQRLRTQITSAKFLAESGLAARSLAARP